jgi:hypothetical protein
LRSKLIGLLLALTLALGGLTACGGDEGGEGGPLNGEGQVEGGEGEGGEEDD